MCTGTLPRDLAGYTVNQVEDQQDLTKGKAQVIDDNSPLDCLKRSFLLRQARSVLQQRDPNSLPSSFAFYPPRRSFTSTTSHQLPLKTKYFPFSNSPVSRYRAAASFFPSIPQFSEGFIGFVGFFKQHSAFLLVSFELVIYSTSITSRCEQN